VEIYDLVSPLVDNRHVNVVNEHRHLLASRRSVRRTHPFVHVALNCTLQNIMNLIVLTNANVQEQIIEILHRTATSFNSVKQGRSQNFCSGGG